MVYDRLARWNISNFNFQRMLFVVLLAILCYLVLPPLFFTIQSSLYVDRGFNEAELSLKNYTDFLTTPETGVMLVNSIWFALGSSLVALTVGTLLAWVVERTDTPFKNLAYLSAFTSFAIPGIVKVIGWIMLFGPEKGVINVWLKELFDLQYSPFNIFTLTGMILVEGVVWAPVVFLFMAAPFRSMDPSLEESALMSGAGPVQTFYHVTLKLALPSVLSVLLLTFVRAMEAFEIPVLIGIPGRVLVLTSEIYLRLSSGLLPQYGMASAYGVVLIFLVSIGLYFYSRATRESQKFYTITGKGFRPRTIEMGKWRYVTTMIVFVLPTLLGFAVADPDVDLGASLLHGTVARRASPVDDDQLFGGVSEFQCLAGSEKQPDHQSNECLSDHASDRSGRVGCRQEQYSWQRHSGAPHVVYARLSQCGSRGGDVAHLP